MTVIAILALVVGLFFLLMYALPPILETAVFVLLLAGVSVVAVVVTREEYGIARRQGLAPPRAALRSLRKLFDGFVLGR